MAMTIDEIKKMLDSGLVVPSEANVVERGVLVSSEGRQFDYRLCHGWDLARAYACDKSWGLFNLELIKFIRDQKYNEEVLVRVLDQVQLDDHHWRWFDKSCAFRADEYDWFYLIANESVQAVCLIYHPKPSALEAGDIFYIEYVAVAPWNRKNPMRERSFKGVGGAIIRYAVNFGRNKLKLKYGFSLHALPKAIEFYERIGMVRHAPLDKDGLPYFEMPNELAREFAEA